MLVYDWMWWGQLTNQNLVQRGAEVCRGVRRGTRRCTEVCGGVCRGARRCAEECMEVRRGAQRGAWRDVQRCAEGCAEVHGGVHRGVCGGVQRCAEVCGGVLVHGYHWLPLATIDLVGDNREFEVSGIFLRSYTHYEWLIVSEL